MEPNSTRGWSQQHDGSYERAVGDSEAAFIPVNVVDGVGDMFMHLGFKAPPALVDAERVAEAWAVLRCRHPVLAAGLVHESEWRLRYTPPSTRLDAIQDAKHCLSFSETSKTELISEHMNGPRALSVTQLSHLTISTTSESSTSSQQSYQFFLAVPHFLGDGTSLHATAHDFIVLLSNPDSILQELDLALSRSVSVLAPALEDRLPRTRGGRFQQAAQAVDYQLTKTREIGGHVLSRSQRGKQRTVMEEVALDESQTAKILAKCKSQGVTVSNVSFAAIALAWSRVTGKPDPCLPIMMYTALNLRPHLLPPPPTQPLPSHWFLALGYFNIVIPSYLPVHADHETILWERARSARRQTKKVVSSRLLIPRTLQMSAERAARALSKPPPYKQLEATALHEPSLALCGLSLMGNLDRTYNQAEYAEDVILDTVTTASKQKSGGLLFLEHTFRDRLWLHLAWDHNGFEHGVIEKFWAEIQAIFLHLAE